MIMAPSCPALTCIPTKSSSDGPPGAAAARACRRSSIRARHVLSARVRSARATRVFSSPGEEKLTVVFPSPRMRLIRLSSSASRVTPVLSITKIGTPASWAAFNSLRVTGVISSSRINTSPSDVPAWRTHSDSEQYGPAAALSSHIHARHGGASSIASAAARRSVFSAPPLIFEETKIFPSSGGRA